MNSFYTLEELKKIGIKKIGNNVSISRFARLYNPELLILGNNVRIDDFCILTGRIILHSNIHIAAYCVLYGSQEIEIHDYSGLSARCTLYSSIDDFSGDYLMSPMANPKFTHVTGGKITVLKYCQIGAHSIVFPDLTINEGVIVGAQSLIKESLNEWRIYVGIPAKILKIRNSNIKNKIENDSILH